MTDELTTPESVALEAEYGPQPDAYADNLSNAKAIGADPKTALVVDHKMPSFDTDAWRNFYQAHPGVALSLRSQYFHAIKDDVPTWHDMTETALKMRPREAHTIGDVAYEVAKSTASRLGKTLAGASAGVQAGIMYLAETPGVLARGEQRTPIHEMAFGRLALALHDSQKESEQALAEKRLTGFQKFGVVPTVSILTDPTTFVLPMAGARAAYSAAKIAGLTEAIAATKALNGAAMVAANQSAGMTLQQNMEANQAEGKGVSLGAKDVADAVVQGAASYFFTRLGGLYQPELAVTGAAGRPKISEALLGLAQDMASEAGESATQQASAMVFQGEGGIADVATAGIQGAVGSLVMGGLTHGARFALVKEANTIHEQIQEGAEGLKQADAIANLVGLAQSSKSFKRMDKLASEQRDLFNTVIGDGNRVTRVDSKVWDEYFSKTTTPPAELMTQLGGIVDGTDIKFDSATLFQNLYKAHGGFLVDNARMGDMQLSGQDARWLLEDGMTRLEKFHTENFADKLPSGAEDDSHLIVEELGPKFKKVIADKVTGKVPKGKGQLARDAVTTVAMSYRRMADEITKATGVPVTPKQLFDKYNLSIGEREGKNGERGFYRSDRIVQLTSKSDASSPHHELSHHFLQLLDYSRQEAGGKSEALNKDWNDLRKWWTDNSEHMVYLMSEKDRALVEKSGGLEWMKSEITKDDFSKIDDTVRTAMHEYVARGYEKFLAEGRAPVGSLKKLFIRLADYIRAVYADLRDLNVNLSDEARAFYARWTTIDAEVQAEMANAPKVMYATKPDTMSDEAWQALIQIYNKPREKAVTKELEKIARERRIRIKEDREKEINDQAVNDVAEQPRFASAIDAASSQEKFNFGEMAIRFGDDIAFRARNQGMTSVDGALDIDQHASKYGFSTPEEMLAGWSDPEGFKKAVDARVAELRAMEGGEKSDEVEARQIAMESLDDEERARIAETELNVLLANNRRGMQTKVEGKEQVNAAAESVRKKMKDVIAGKELQSEQEVIKLESKIRDLKTLRQWDAENSRLEKDWLAARLKHEQEKAVAKKDEKISELKHRIKELKTQTDWDAAGSAKAISELKAKHKREMDWLEAELKHETEKAEEAKDEKIDDLKHRIKELETQIRWDTAGSDKEKKELIAKSEREKDWLEAELKHEQEKQQAKNDERIAELKHRIKEMEVQSRWDAARTDTEKKASKAKQEATDEARAKTAAEMVRPMSKAEKAVMSLKVSDRLMSMTPTELRRGKFRQQADLNNKKALAALARDDIDGAITAKQLEVWLREAARQADEIRTQMDNAIKRIKRKDSVEARTTLVQGSPWIVTFPDDSQPYIANTMDMAQAMQAEYNAQNPGKPATITNTQAYLTANDVVKSMYSFGPVPQGATPGESVGQIFESMALDQPNLIPQSVFDRAMPVEIKDLAIKDIVEAADALDAIAAAADRQHDINLADKRVAAAKVVGDYAAQLAKQKKPTVTDSKTLFGKAVRAINSMETLSQRVRFMDGEKEDGAFARTILKMVHDAQNRKYLLEKAHIEGALAKANKFTFSEQRENNRKIEVPGVGARFSPMEIMQLALYWGSPEGRQRITSNMRLSDVQMKALLDSLNAKQIAYVNDVHAAFEGLRRPLGEAYVNSGDPEPRWVASMPTEAKNGVLTGGYVRLKYVDERVAPDAMPDVQKGLYMNHMPANGHTKLRQESVEGKTLDLDPARHVWDMHGIIRDIAFKQAATDIWKLIGTGTTGSKMLVSHFGGEFVNDLKAELAQVFVGPARDRDYHRNIFSWLRNNYVSAQLVGNFFSAATQPIGIITSLSNPIVRRNFVPAMHALLSDPVNMSRWIRDADPMMAERAESLNNDMADATKTVNTIPVVSWLSKNRFVLQRKFQAPVDLATWLSAYTSFKNDGKSHDDAVFMASRIVADTQSGSRTSDMPTAMKSELTRWLFMFGSYKIALLGQVKASWRRNITVPEQRSIGVFAMEAASVLFAQALVYQALRAGLKGAEFGPDEEGLTEWIKFAARVSATELTGLSPVLNIPFNSAINGMPMDPGPLKNVKSLARVVTAPISKGPELTDQQEQSLMMDVFRSAQIFSGAVANEQFVRMYKAYMNLDKDPTAFQTLLFGSTSTANK